MTRLMRPGSVDTLPGVFVFSTLFSSVPTSTLAASRKLRLAVVLSMSVPLAVETAPHFTVQIKFHNAVRCVKDKNSSLAQRFVSDSFISETNLYVSKVGIRFGVHSV